MCGLTDDPDPAHWKKGNADTRVSVSSLARGLDRHPLIASTIIEKHKRTYPRFWEWRADMAQKAMVERQTTSVFGWPLRISTSPNQRTLYNFPMQSNGGEMLRIAATRLCDAGIVPIMLVHDAILLEESTDEKIEHAKEIMLAAGRNVCGGLEIGVDAEPPLKGGARYRDKRPMATSMWAAIMSVLQAINALPREATA
jgi:DNA polymerase-1